MYVVICMLDLFCCRLAPKINAPPSNPDEQEVPKSLLNLMHLKQMTKEGKFGKKKRKRNRKNRLINTAKLVGREIKIPGKYSLINCIEHLPRYFIDWAYI